MGSVRNNGYVVYFLSDLRERERERERERSTLMDWTLFICFLPHSVISVISLSAFLHKTQRGGRRGRRKIGKRGGGGGGGRGRGRGKEITVEREREKEKKSLS